MEYIIETYGYLIITVGTFFEGETILIMAGFIAHQGYLELPWVIVAAFVGSVLGDQLYFFIGRRYGQKIFDKRPALQVRTEKIEKMLERYHIPVILAFRFIYGMRTITPFAIGASRVPIWLFAVLNFITGLAWAALIGTIGYMFGNAAELIVKNIEHYELEALGVIAIFGLSIWAFHLYRRRRLKVKSKDLQTSGHF